MSSFKCPFCGVTMVDNSQTHAHRNFNFDYSSLDQRYSGPYLHVSIFKCPNEECRKETVFAYGMNGYINDSGTLIYPKTICESFPEYVPAPIREDYKEACAILTLSPKASATLSRRCLQGMIHDFWNIHEKNLNAEITQLKSRIPAAQWRAIDALRSIGNIGAHMEHDVNMVVDIEPEEAEKLIRLIEHLIGKWYINRHDEEQLYADLALMGDEKASARKK